MIDLEPAAREVVRLLEGVSEDRLTDPTPCDGTSVAVLGLEGANGNALEVRRSDPTSPATRALPGPRWRDGAQAATAAHAQRCRGAPRYRSAPVNSSIERRRRAGRHSLRRLGSP